MAPPGGRNLADDTYMLSTAPMGLDTPARSYRIDVSADTLALNLDRKSFILEIVARLASAAQDRKPA